MSVSKPAWLSTVSFYCSVFCSYYPVTSAAYIKDASSQFTILVDRAQGILAVCVYVRVCVRSCVCALYVCVSVSVSICVFCV